MKYSNNKSNQDIRIIEKGNILPPSSYHLSNINEIDKIHETN